MKFPFSQIFPKLEHAVPVKQATRVHFLVEFGAYKRKVSAPLVNKNNLEFN